MTQSILGSRNVLFSKTISTNPFGDGDDNISISLECDDELGFQLSDPKSVITYEAFSTGFPFLLVTFLDGRGDLLNAKKLDTGAIYTLNIGSYDGSVVESRWRLAHIEHVNSSAGKSEQGAFTLHFVHQSWKDMCYNTHNRGWSNVRYSDIVQGIADECGFDVTDIIRTGETLENVQQPNWTNEKMLKWILERASPLNGSGEYEYSISLDGKFVFAPFSSYINQEFRIRNSAGDAPISLVVGGPPNNTQVRSSERLRNSNSQFNVINYTVLEEGNSYHRQGAGGVVNSWYDYNSAEYHRESKLYSETDNLQLSEWSVVNEEYETAPLHLIHGRNSTEAETIGDNRICSIVNGMTQVRATIPTTTILRVGELAELVIDVSPEYRADQGQKNEIHSGKYVIASVKNKFMSRGKKNTFLTEILLVRPGNDKKESNYYTKSTRGKV